MIVMQLSILHDGDLKFSRAKTIIEGNIKRPWFVMA